MSMFAYNGVLMWASMEFFFSSHVLWTKRLLDMFHAHAHNNFLWLQHMRIYDVHACTSIFLMPSEGPPGDLRGSSSKVFPEVKGNS